MATRRVINVEAVYTAQLLAASYDTVNSLLDLYPKFSKRAYVKKHLPKAADELMELIKNGLRLVAQGCPVVVYPKRFGPWQLTEETAGPLSAALQGLVDGSVFAGTGIAYRITRYSEPGLETIHEEVM